MEWAPGDRVGGAREGGEPVGRRPSHHEKCPGEAMVHDDRTYMDDEGIEYVVPGGEDEESGSIVPVYDSPGGRLWGADDAWGGYAAE